MIHPHGDDLKSLSDLQIHEKLKDLNKKYFMTTNAQLQEQIIMLIDGYKLELEARNVSKSLKKDENELDNLINIS